MSLREREDESPKERIRDSREELEELAGTDLPAAVWAERLLRIAEENKLREDHH